MQTSSVLNLETLRQARGRPFASGLGKRRKQPKPRGRLYRDSLKKILRRHRPLASSPIDGSWKLPGLGLTVGVEPTLLPPFCPESSNRRTAGARDRTSGRVLLLAEVPLPEADLSVWPGQHPGKNRRKGQSVQGGYYSFWPPPFFLLPKEKLATRILIAKFSLGRLEGFVLMCKPQHQDFGAG